MRISALYYGINEMKEADLKYLAIEITNRCNLKCSMCVSHGATVYKGQAEGYPPFMDIDLFREIVAQYKRLPGSGFKSVTPQFQGESLLDARFLRFCEILEEAGIHFGFTTNATLLNQELVKSLLEFRFFSSINFSLDGLSKSTYESIRIGAKYESVVENIDYFLKAVKSRKKPHRSMTFVCQDANRHELDDFIRRWHPRISINVNTICKNGRPVEYKWKPARIPCQDVFSFMAVLTNGKVATCCRDYEYTMDMGNLGQNSLAEIWHGIRYNELRLAQVKGNYEKFPLCRDCDTWMTSVPERREEMFDGCILLRHGPYWTNIPMDN